MQPKYIYVLFACLSGVSFIIGLPMWLVGCEPYVPNGCLTRDLIPSNVTGISTVSGICCSSCKCGKSTCCCGGYSCYNAQLSLDTSVGDCTTTLDGVYSSDSSARAAAASYGPTPTVVIDPRTKLCSVNLASFRSIWVAGMFFMCTTALLVVIWLGVFIVHRVRKCIRRPYPSMNVQPSNPAFTNSSLELNVQATSSSPVTDAAGGSNYTGSDYNNSSGTTAGGFGAPPTSSNYTSSSGGGFGAPPSSSDYTSSSGGGFGAPPSTAVTASAYPTITQSDTIPMGHYSSSDLDLPRVESDAPPAYEES